MPRTRFVLAAVGLLACIGCVSETVRADGTVVEEGRAGTPTPVEVAEQQIRKKIQHMRVEAGAELLTTMQHVAACRELAIGPIREELATADAPMRANLIYVLGLIGGTEAHAIVAAELSDKNPVVRYEAAAALLQFRDWSGVPVLIGFLKDEDRRMRYKAFQALNDFTKEDFGYEFGAPAAHREAAVDRWMSWWKARRAEIIYR